MLRSLALLQRMTVVRKVSALSLGSFLGAAVGLVGSAVVARLYSAEQFGEFSADLGVALVGSLIGTMSIPSLIALEESEGQANTLFLVGIIGSLLFGPVTTLALAKFLTMFDVSLGPSSNLLILSVTISLLSMVRPLAARRNDTASLATVAVIEPTLQAITQVGLHPTAMSGSGLSLGYSLAKLVSFLGVMWRQFGKVSQDIGKLRQIKRWLPLMLVLTPQGLLGLITLSALGPILVTLYGTSVAGQWSLVSRILGVPSLLLGQAVATVFYPRFAKKFREERESDNEAELVLRLLFLVGFPIFLGVAISSPWLFPIMFGPGWSDSGLLAAVLSPWLLVTFMSSPLSGLLTIHNQRSKIMVLGVGEAIFRILSLWIGYVCESWLIGAILYSAVGIVLSGLTIFWSLSASKQVFYGLVFSKVMLISVLLFSLAVVNASISNAALQVILIGLALVASLLNLRSQKKVILTLVLRRGEHSSCREI